MFVEEMERCRLIADSSTYFKSALATFLSVLSWLLGGLDTLALCLMVSITLDFLGGIIHAYVDGTLSSKRMRIGIIRKSGYFAIVVMAAVLDRTLFQSSPIARTLTISYLIANESLSILEHVAAIGVPIPESLRKKLLSLKEEVDREDVQDDSQKQP